MPKIQLEKRAYLEGVSLQGLIKNLQDYLAKHPEHKNTQVVLMINPRDTFVEHYPNYIQVREETDSGAKFVVISDESGY